MARLSLTRHLLPGIALLGIAVAIYLIVAQAPDRSMDKSDETPARATGALADAPRVADAGCGPGLLGGRRG
ncbi:hypothetical protein [Sphingomicrobium astaxanthinifaciens]|uniref:hypothetical protein n=1 Tax=Sphingomicrobium astaxanthinifaciens TaxID=1227949 RepID=UPI001FCB1787|nr:hypothetical protein [Sphingomicrobium astaxanthinifaciens]MCJ7420939.1 hypothetical protein [Sphingomicrobium astaxanthinifaciens]